MRNTCASATSVKSFGLSKLFVARSECPDSISKYVDLSMPACCATYSWVKPSSARRERKRCARLRAIICSAAEYSFTFKI